MMLWYLIVSAILMLAQGHHLRMPQPCDETQMSAIRKCGDVDVMVQLMTKRSFIGYFRYAEYMSLRLLMDCSHYMNADTDGDSLHVFKNISDLFRKLTTDHRRTNVHDDVYCQMFERYEQCVTESGVRELCASPEDITIHIASAYMCGAGKKEYDEAAICLSNIDLGTLGIYNNPGCEEVTDGFFKYLENLHSIPGQDCDDVQQLLNYLNETQYTLGEFDKRCLLPWARRECGASAEALLDGTHRYVEDFMEKFFERIKPTLKINKTFTWDMNNEYPKDNQYVELLMKSLGIFNHISSLIEETVDRQLKKCSVAWCMEKSAMCFLEICAHHPIRTNGPATYHSALDAFEDLCSRYISRYISCVRPHIGSCPPNLVTKLNGALTHICSYMPAILREGQCLDSVIQYAPDFKESCGFTQLEIYGMLKTMKYLWRASKFKETLVMCERMTNALVCVTQEGMALVKKYAPKDCSDEGKTAITSLYDYMIMLHSSFCKDMESTFISLLTDL